MTVHSWILTEFADRLAWTLLNSLWEGAAVAAILGLVLGCLSRRAAHARYLALIVAMLALVTAFGITLFVSGSPVSQPQSPLIQFFATKPSDALHSTMQIRIVPSQQNEPMLLTQPSSDPAGRLDHWANTISLIAAIGWLVGVALLAVWRVAGWITIQRLRALSTEPAPPLVLQSAQRLAQRLHLTKSFEILISHFTQTPMMIGWLSPVILIPASAISGLTAAQLEAILAHELAHIRRHDYLVNLVQILAETLMFYHPAIWWISSRLRLEREQACDDIAVSVCADRYEYAGSLVAIEELRLMGSPALAASGSGGSQLLTRIRRILQPAEDPARWGLPSLFLLLAIAVSSVIIYGQMIARADNSPEAQNATAGTPPQPFNLQNNAPRRSPFTAIRWRGDTAEVRYNETWYELVSINDLTTAKILDYLKQSNDFAPQKHFAEDMVEVMRDMGAQPGDTVKLQLQTLETKQAVTIPDAPMTEANRRRVLLSDSDRSPKPGAATTDNIFRFEVPFQNGVAKFADGDQITVTKVQGTSPDMESGICCISGTYTLASQDKATLAASVTSSDPKDGVGPWNDAQTIKIEKGSGTFTLVLPVSIKGWPHVSFYGDKSDFGGIYIGTGKWVLRQLWDADERKSPSNPGQ